MTESSTTAKVQYNGDGATVSFSTAFKFTLDADVVVIHTTAAGVETTWVKGTQYTLVGAGLGVNGTVTVVTTPTDYTPASGTKLTIKRVPAFTQTTDLPVGGPLPSTNIEDMADRNVHMMQSIKEELDRSAKLSATSSESAPTLPDLTGNAGKYLEVSTAETGFNLVTPAAGAVIGTPVSVLLGGTGAPDAPTALVNLGIDGAAGNIATGDIADNAVTLAKMAGGTDGNLITYDASGDPAYVVTGTAGQILTSGGVGVAPTFQDNLSRNFIAGLELSKSAADVLAIAAGDARDDANAVNMTLAAFTKDVSSAFAVGTGNGSLDTGAYAGSTLYYVWLMRRSDTGVVDILTSVSGTNGTITKPAGYDGFRLIGYFNTDATPDILAFVQVGDYFRTKGVPVTDVSDATITTDVFETATISAPRWSEAIMKVYWAEPAGAGGTNSRFTIRPTAAAETATHPDYQQNDNNSQSVQAAGLISCIVDASSQLDYEAVEESGRTTTLTIYTVGCHMYTRSNPI